MDVVHELDYLRLGLEPVRPKLLEGVGHEDVVGVLVCLPEEESVDPPCPSTPPSPVASPLPVERRVVPGPHVPGYRYSHGPRDLRVLCDNQGHRSVRQNDYLLDSDSSGRFPVSRPLSPRPGLGSRPVTVVGGPILWRTGSTQERGTVGGLKRPPLGVRGICGATYRIQGSDSKDRLGLYTVSLCRIGRFGPETGPTMSSVLGWSVHGE